MSDEVTSGPGKLFSGDESLDMIDETVGQTRRLEPLGQEPLAGHEVAQVALGDVLTGRFRYRLERQLGHGGNGAVYLASCLDVSEEALEALEDRPPRIVALKLFHSPTGPTPQQMLKRELSSLLALRSDRIPRVYDWSIERNLAFCAIHYYSQGSLSDLLAAGRYLEADQTLRLLTDISRALADAHRASILHLDVKPANVLLDGAGGFVLTDFGISQGSLVSRSIISTGVGTRAYQSPEQRRIEHEAFDARTDLWGLGMTAWCAFTGTVLTKHTELLTPSPAVSAFGLPLLSQKRTDCPPELEEMIMPLIGLDPALRPGSAAEVLAQAEEFARGSGVTIRTARALRQRPVDPSETQSVIDAVLDPLWYSICSMPGFHRYLVRFEDGEILCSEGEKSFFTLVLLSGRVRVEREGRLLTTEDRQGTFLGEVTALAGAERTATLRAAGTVWACAFNAAELENLIASSPAAGIRLVKSLAERVLRESAFREKA